MTQVQFNTRQYCVETCECFVDVPDEIIREGEGSVRDYLWDNTDEWDGDCVDMQYDEYDGESPMILALPDLGDPQEIANGTIELKLVPGQTPLEAVAGWVDRVRDNC